MPSRFLRAAIFAVVTVGASLAHAQQAQPGLLESLGSLFKPADSPAASEEKPATRNLSAAIPQGERRVALVIGNNAYRHVNKLDNAVADAKAMAREFRALGFDVIERTDIDQRGMKAAVREFVGKVANGGIGAFFFAGHGVQQGGNNFLLPVDISALSDPAALPDEAVELNGEVMARIGEVGARFSLLVIDACRNNPFPRVAGRSIGGTRGLAVPSTPDGMIVVYSAGVGQEALDRVGDNDRDPNGLFTREFIREIRKPGLEVAQVVRNVGQRVKEQAAKVRHQQTPAIYIQAGNFYLIPNAESVTVQGAPASAEDSFWAALNPAQPCEYQAYLDQHPQGKYVALARRRLAECAPKAETAKPAVDPPKIAVPPAPTSAPPVAVVPDNPEADTWNEVKKGGTKEYFEAYLKQYPKGKYAGLAKVELKKLDDKDKAERAREESAKKAERARQDAEQKALAERERQDVQRAEQDAWEQAKAASTVAAYAEYLGSYPKGRYAALAQAAQQKVQREAAEREKHEVAQRRQEEERQRVEAERQRLAAERERREAEKAAGELRPGKAFKDCADCPEMVMIPAGSFEMGSPTSEIGRFDDEGPQHRVSVRSFAAGKFEVTRGQFAAFVAASGHNAGTECYTFESSKYEKRSGRNWQNPGYSQADSHPVVCVNWDDARAYVAWLSRKTGKSYRLLSEAEWEYAARAGTTTARYWGESPDQACSYANVMDATGKSQVPGVTWEVHKCTDGHAYTAPAGSFKPNAFGLYDMIGNAWEGTEDCWNNNYTGAPSDGSAWASGQCSVGRVLRGGSWDGVPRNARSAKRYGIVATGRISGIGFRLARMLP